MKPLVYKNISQAQIDTMSARVISSGGNIANQGNGIFVVTGHGVKSTARYDGKDLTVTIDSKPFYIPVSAIENGLDEALGESHGTE